jgi:hypothetical protein
MSNTNILLSDMYIPAMNVPAQAETLEKKPQVEIHVWILQAVALTSKGQVWGAMSVKGAYMEAASRYI